MIEEILCETNSNHHNSQNELQSPTHNVLEPVFCLASEDFLNGHFNRDTLAGD